MPGLNLVKGQGVNLFKEDPNLRVIEICLGWKPNGFVGNDFDLDGSLFAVDANGKCREQDVLFYETATTIPMKGHKDDKVFAILNGAAWHSGDAKTGSEAADDKPDEIITVDLARISAEFPHIKTLAVPVTIYKAEERGNQNFGQVEGAYISIRNKETGAEILRYNLAEKFDVQDALVFGELSKNDAGEWNFRAIGQGFKGGDFGLIPLMKRYGVPIAPHPAYNHLL